MSDNISNRHSINNEVFEVVLGNKSIREPANLYQLQWVAHWTRSSTSSQYHQHFAAPNIIKDQIRGQNYLPVENIKPSSTFVRRNASTNAQSSSIDCKNFSSYGFQNSTSTNSDWKQFPMFEINRKIETIMAPKKRASFSTIAERKNEQVLCLPSTPHLIELSSEKHRHQQEERRARSDDEMILADCNEDENDVLESKQQFSNASLTYLKNELCDSSDKNIVGLSKLSKMSNVSTINLQSARTRVASTSSGSKKEDKVSADSTVPENVGKIAFFEKLTLPSMLYRQSSANNMVHTDEIDSQFAKKQEEQLVKTDMLCQIQSSSEAGNFLKAQKVSQSVGRAGLKSSKIVDTYTDASETQNLNIQPFVSLMRSTQLDSELSSKWVKRLHPNTLDIIPLSAKRFKMEDSPSSGEMQNLLARVVNYNRSISDLPECKQLDKMNFYKDGEGFTSEKVMPWIRRWCRSSRENATQSAVLCEPENSRLLTENFEAKQFPSLAAMALVGKQVTNFRPCEFQKRGSTVVWNA